MIELKIELVEGRQGKIQKWTLNALLREQGFTREERANELGVTEKTIERKDKIDRNTPCIRHFSTRYTKNLETLSANLTTGVKIYCPFCRIEDRFLGFFSIDEVSHRASRSTSKSF